MALYHNHTRFDAVVTIRLTAVQDPAKALLLGIESAMKPCALTVGVHDLTIPAGAVLDLPDGTTAEFLASRRA